MNAQSGNVGFTTAIISKVENRTLLPVVISTTMAAEGYTAKPGKDHYPLTVTPKRTKPQEKTASISRMSEYISGYGEIDTTRMLTYLAHTDEACAEAATLKVIGIINDVIDGVIHEHNLCVPKRQYRFKPRWDTYKKVNAESVLKHTWRASQTGFETFDGNITIEVEEDEYQFTIQLGGANWTHYFLALCFGGYEGPQGITHGRYSNDMILTSLEDLTIMMVPGLHESWYNVSADEMVETYELTILNPTPLTRRLMVAERFGDVYTQNMIRAPSVTVPKRESEESQVVIHDNERGLPTHGNNYSGSSCIKMRTLPSGATTAWVHEPMGIMGSLRLDFTTTGSVFLAGIHHTTANVEILTNGDSIWRGKMMLPLHDTVELMGVSHIVMALAPRNPRARQSRLCTHCLTRGVVNDRSGPCKYIHKTYNPKTMMMTDKVCGCVEKTVLQTYYRTYDFNSYGVHTTMKVLLYEPAPYFITPRPMNSANFSTACNSGCLHLLSCILRQDMLDEGRCDSNSFGVYYIDVENTLSVSLLYMYYSALIIKNNLAQKEFNTWTPGSPFQAGLDTSIVIQPQIIIAGAIGVSRMVYFHVLDTTNLWLKHHNVH
jgi:hypothetical protein